MFPFLAPSDLKEAEEKQTQTYCPYQLVAFCRATKRGSPRAVAQSKESDDGGQGSCLGHSIAPVFLLYLLLQWCHLGFLNRRNIFYGKPYSASPVSAGTLCLRLAVLHVQGWVPSLLVAPSRLADPVTPACADPLEGDHVVTRELQGT
jgi:hypothetical protein